MDIGLQVFNDYSNTLQLDSNYRNFRLVNRYRVNGSYNSPKEFICKSGMLYGVCPANYDISMAIQPSHTIVNNVIVQSYKVYGQAIIYEFDSSIRDADLVSSGEGLELFDANGKLIFDSDDKLLKVIDYVTGSLQGIALGSNVHTCASVFGGWEDTPSRIYVLGLVPITYTGAGFKVVPRAGNTTSHYEVSTLFFRHSVINTWSTQLSASYNRFYYRDTFAFANTTSLKTWFSSTVNYSLLVVDTSSWPISLPPIVVLP